MAALQAMANEFDLNFTGDSDGCWAIDQAGSGIAPVGL